MKKDNIHRILFCTFWLYFNAFRGILGHVRFLDYLCISLVPIGIIGLLLTAKASNKVILWVTIFVAPIAIAAIVDPSVGIFVFLLKSYVVALYVAIYLKSMRLTTTELVCFLLPVLISVYYFINPRYPDETYLLQGRLSGIDEPNFTSLSLILSMCAAYAIYTLRESKYVKMVMIIAISICCWGILSTASRAGFMGGIIAVCSFFVMNRMKWYISMTVIAAAILVALNANTIMDVVSRLTVFGRFQTLSSTQGSLMKAIIDERPFMEYAWNTVRQGEWFIGGGPGLVMKWADVFRHVPHNSLLDIGLAFGKASFFFYGALLVVLWVVNLLSMAVNRFSREIAEEDIALTPLFFLSLTPMYMFLSAGLSMSFIFWVALGTYPLLHPSIDLAKVLSKTNIIRYMKVK